MSPERPRFTVFVRLVVCLVIAKNVYSCVKRAVVVVERRGKHMVRLRRVHEEESKQFLRVQFSTVVDWKLRRETERVLRRRRGGLSNEEQHHQ